VAARDGAAVAVHRARNRLASPLRYELHPSDLYEILDGIEEAGLQLGAIYHSHTRSAPIPSETDINLALYPDPLYVIVGLKDAADADVRAWTIRDGQVTEGELQVEG
jgi:proteasome lid subunit RPN8/RPN11